MSSPIAKEDIVYNGQLDAFELYHLIVESAEKPSSRNGGPALPALGHAIAGSVATATSKLLIYPLDLVVARLQVQKQLRDPAAQADEDAEYKGLLDAASKIYRHEGGLQAFYTGCATEVTKGIADSFVFFLAYNFLQHYETKRATARKQQMSVMREMGIGIAAGAFSKLITTPLQNIITRQQTAALLKSKSTKSDVNLRRGDAMTVSDIARMIYKERGLQGFWAGYSLSLILTLNPAITFAVDNFLQKVKPGDAAPHVTFLIAAVSKAIATSITYPVSVAKSRAQAMPHSKIAAREGTDKQTSTGTKLLHLLSAQYAMFVSLQKIYQKEGLGGLYSGLEGEVLKGFLSHGLTMMVKDKVHIGIIELYYVLLKAVGQWPKNLLKAHALAASVVVDARQKIQNVSETVVEGGKNIAGEVQAKAENVGTTIAEGGKQVLHDVSVRAENLGSTISEGSQHALHDAGHRVDNVSTTLAEAGSNALNDVKDRAGNISTTLSEGSKYAAGDVSERAGNIATTVVEGAKSATAGIAEPASNVGATVLEAGKSMVSNASARVEQNVLSADSKSALNEIGERASNVGGTVAEAGKHAVLDAQDKASNIGTTIIEGGKSAVDHLKKSE